jgi:hypothetical protein
MEAARNLYLACHFLLNYYVTGNIVPILSSAKGFVSEWRVIGARIV